MNDKLGGRAFNHSISIFLLVHAMSLITNKIKALLVLGLVVLTTENLVSCMCEMTPLDEHLKSTKTIVVGRVVQLLDTEEERENYIFSNPSNSYRVLIEIETVYKGRVKKSRIIELGSQFSNCDIYFNNGKKYLLFLEKKGKRYFMRHCSYSGELDKVVDTIKDIENELK